LEAANRKLQVELDDVRVVLHQQQELIQQLQGQLADALAKLRTNSTNSSLPLLRIAFTANAHRQPERQPIRGACAHGGCHLPSARQESVGLSGGVRPGLASQPIAAFLIARRPLKSHIHLNA